MSLSFSHTETPRLPPDACDGEYLAAVGTALVNRASMAHEALMQGDLARYQDALRTSDDLLLMTPFGGPPTRGQDLTPDRWAEIARFFRNGRHSTFELLASHAADTLVVLAGIERTTAEIGGLPAQEWALRVTLVFRRESDNWLLLHRHADPLVHGVSLQEAAAMAKPRTP